jgi:hypothetical protein
LIAKPPATRSAANVLRIVPGRSISRTPPPRGSGGSRGAPWRKPACPRRPTLREEVVVGCFSGADPH